MTFNGEKAQGDNRPFPIQGGERNAGWGVDRYDPCSIPWWLAEIAYEEYSRMFGTEQSLERLAERGGFGRDELVALLRKKYETG